MPAFRFVHIHFSVLYLETHLRRSELNPPLPLVHVVREENTPGAVKFHNSDVRNGRSFGGFHIHGLQKQFLPLRHVQKPTRQVNVESRNELKSFNAIYFRVTSLINGLQR
jgi:hypothetical protein